jgi:hypothetical protein
LFKPFYMQRFIFILAAFLFCNTVWAQADSSTCVDYHQGYFSYTDSLGNVVLVDRHKKYQYEKNTATKVKTQFRINWTGSCTYQITQTLTNSKAARKYKNSSSTVVIAATDGAAGYTYSCACKDASKNSGGYMKKLSKKEYYSLF